MKVVQKKRIARHGADRAPLCGFITYIHPQKPVLLRRTGWEVSNDIHDDFADAFSRDNGRTWSRPRPALKSIPVPGGVICHTENAALYVPGRNLLIHWTNDKFETSLKGGNDLGKSSRIRITAGEPGAASDGTAPDPFISDFGFKQGIYVSFATPFLDSRGRPLVPVIWQKRDHPSLPIHSAEFQKRKQMADGASGSWVDDFRIGPTHGRCFPMRPDMPDVFANYWEAGLLIGEFRKDGTLAWHVSAAVPCDFEKSSRGMVEGTVAELADGRLIMVLRGSNGDWPEKRGYKWLTFSDDLGETWSEAEPLRCDDGTLIESSATGSALFRSGMNGRLYWIGNLCLDWRRPNGNMPRSPLYIAEIQEDPVAIRRKTITVIDQSQPGEDPDTQHSNFKFYEDRKTGELVVLLTRYGERGYADNTWIRADLHEYRIALGERRRARPGVRRRG